MMVISSKLDEFLGSPFRVPPTIYIYPVFPG